MKILQVCHRYYPNVGGVEEHVRSISERLARKNDVTVFTTDPSGKLVNEEILNGVTVKRFRSWAPNDSYFFSRELEKYLKRESGNFDVVHAHTYQAFPALYAARAKSSNKFVFTPHYSGKGETAFRTFLHVPYKFLGKKIFDKADAILSTSEFEKNLIHHNFGVDLRRITIIPNGVDLNEFRRCEKNEHSGRRIIISVGRLEKFKGVDYVIKALPYLEQDINLEIVGDGSYYECLQRLVAQLGIKNRVTFFGGTLPRKQILRKYSNADLAILLSEHECFGLTIAEALASGTVCIVARTTALTEWVDNKNCFGVQYPIDMKELIGLINAIIEKPVSNPKIVDWTDVVSKILNVYNCSS